MAELVVTALSKRLGGKPVVSDLSLTVGSSELVCLLGPSGCGKTTTLRMIGGFVAPDAGQITIGGKDVTAVAPERRPTAMVFQSYALWPNMTVFKNVGFGLRLRKLPKAEIADRVDQVLQLVNLSHTAGRHPAQLSGGEQQRVALARALVLEPDLLLLDEPLSNLDARLRVAVREEIREIQQRLKIATLFVTHDQDEALSISDRIAVMSGGKIEQFDRPAVVYRRPATTFVAGFVGSMNFFRARVEPGRLVLADGTVLPCQSLAEAGAEAREFDAAVRPEDVLVQAAGHGDESAADPGATATVTHVVPRGHFSEVVLDIGGTVTLRTYVGPGDEPGVAEQMTVRIRRVLLYRDGVLAPERDTSSGSVTAGVAGS
jgi:putative spermidine/putrescine transport system ATP-binding protein